MARAELDARKLGSSLAEAANPLDSLADILNNYDDFTPQHAMLGEYKACASNRDGKQNMKALELLLQYGNEEEKKKARTKLLKLSRIDDSSSSSDEVSNAESSDEDSDQE